MILNLLRSFFVSQSAAVLKAASMTRLFCPNNALAPVFLREDYQFFFFKIFEINIKFVY